MKDIDWIEIPAGKFIFGLSRELSNHLQSQLPGSNLAALTQELNEDEPVRELWLDTFYISRFPITCKQEFEFAQSDHRFSYSKVFSSRTKETFLEDLKKDLEIRGDHPADTSWHFAMAFCDWIGARLPTSAQWEKAARGTDGRLYPWGNNWDHTLGNFNKIWPYKTSSVSAYPGGQSPYGVMDLMGNTYELTSSTTFGPEGKSEGVVVRSCSFEFSREANADWPDWFRNRLTAIMKGGMNFGPPHWTGFRPVMDKWQKQAWAGF
jgi:serine/threonine-protein kinase